MLQAFIAQKVTKLRNAFKVNRTRSVSNTTDVNFPKDLHFLRAPCVCMHTPSLGCSSSARWELHNQEPQDRNTHSTPIIPCCQFPTSTLYSGCLTPPNAAGHIFPLEKNPHCKTTSQQCNPEEDRAWFFGAFPSSPKEELTEAAGNTRTNYQPTAPHRHLINDLQGSFIHKKYVYQQQKAELCSTLRITLCTSHLWSLLLILGCLVVFWGYALLSFKTNWPLEFRTAAVP